MIDGIHYKRVIESASLDEKIRLCPEEMQNMLNAVRAIYPEKKMQDLSLTCVNIPAAVKNEKNVRVLMAVIERICQTENTEMSERISSYIGSAFIGKDKDSLMRLVLANSSKFLKFLKYREDTELSLDEISSGIIEPDYGLRYYQLMAVRNISTKLEESPHCVMYHAPTGSGKTRTAMSVVTQHLRIHGPTTVLWLASSKELVEQAAKTFTSAWGKHGDISCMLRIWRGDYPHFNPDDEPPRNNMLIGGLQKVAMACSKNRDVPEKLQKIVSLIVFDEAHQSTAPTYRQIIDGIMKGGKCQLLGLSATPGRASEQSTDELADIYHGKKVSTWSPTGTSPIQYLVQLGYLAQVEFYKIDMDGGLSSSDPGDGDYSIEDLEKIGKDMSRNTMIVDTVSRIIKDGHSRILVFSPSVNSARMCAAMLKTIYGVENSFSLDASTRESTRVRILDRYTDKTDKDVHVIFNYGILTTGFDAPRTSAAVIARPTTSVSLYSQMVGRAIRGRESGGNEKAVIYTVVDVAFPQFSDIAAAFDNWNLQWERKNYE